MGNVDLWVKECSTSRVGYSRSEGSEPLWLQVTRTQNYRAAAPFPDEGASVLLHTPPNLQHEFHRGTPSLRLALRTSAERRQPLVCLECCPGTKASARASHHHY